jgi:flagellar protein FliO/FliZ
MKKRGAGNGLLWLATWLAAASAAVGADDSKVIFPKTSAAASAPTAEAGSSPWAGTVVGALVLVAGGVWFLARSRAAKSGGGVSLSALKVEETKPLGNRQFLVVASYEGQKFLLGVVPGRIDFLSALRSDETAGKGDR